MSTRLIRHFLPTWSHRSANPFIYLACPYTSPDLEVRQTRVEVASIVAADLAVAGKAVYSPITHGHPMSQHLPTRVLKEHDFWMGQCLPILAAADELWLLPLEGWAASRGVCEELAFAEQHGIPVKVIEHLREPWNRYLASNLGFKHDRMEAVDLRKIGGCGMNWQQKTKLPQPTQEQLDEFIKRAGFSWGWANLESVARRMAERAVSEIEAAKAAALQSQPAESARLLDSCKSIIDGIAVSSAVLKQSSQPAAPGVTGAVQTLIEALKADPEYAWAWHCNVAMAAVDEGLSHYQANKAAARFLSWLAQIDTTTHPGFPKATEQPAEAGVSDADLYGTLEAAIVSRYIVEKRVGGGFWGYCVKAGDGAKEIFVGHKNACEHVRQALQTACLDGAYMAHEKARAIFALRPQAVPMTCAWTEDDETGNYATTCGHVFALNDGGPADNGMKFCCYCGGSITAQGAQGGEG